jgi:hypothetical protein
VGSNPTLSAKKHKNNGTQIHPVRCLLSNRVNADLQDSKFKKALNQKAIAEIRVLIIKITRFGRDRGEMTELAEGARLEIVCSAKSGTVGSNPTLSAMHHVGCMAALNST